MHHQCLLNDMGQNTQLTYPLSRPIVISLPLPLQGFESIVKLTFLCHFQVDPKRAVPRGPGQQEMISTQSPGGQSVSLKGEY